MAGRARRRAQPREPGVGVDAQGGAVIDPTANVLDLVQAANRRQDDLREADSRRREADSRHIRELAALRADYDGQLRKAESARIDAIRAVDVGAVQRAAEVALTQASTLAAQVATSAETLRTQVAAAASAQSVSLAAALVPLQEAIADLRRAQYEAQGVKAQTGEAREVRGDARLNLNTVIIAMGLVIAAVTLVIGLRK